MLARGKPFRITIKNEEKEFEELFFKFYPLVCGIADKYLKDEVLSKDLAQDAFVKLWDKRNELKNIVSIKAYLFTTIKNLCLNYIRDHQKNIEIKSEIPDQADIEFKSIIIEEETVALLYEAIKRLPPQSSKIIHLTLKGFKNQRIAEMLGISVNTVKTLKYNAMDSLRKEMKGAFIPFIFVISFLLS